MKREATAWEVNIWEHIWWKSYSKYIKNSHNLVIRRQTSQLKKWEKDLNRYFIKEDTWVAKKHTKKLKLKPQRDYDFILARMVKMKKD